MPKLSWDPEFTSKAVSSCFPGTLTSFWFYLGLQRKPRIELIWDERFCPVWTQGIQDCYWDHKAVMNTLWMWTDVFQMAHVSQTSCYIGIKSLLSLLKIESSPIVMWNPGHKEACRKAGNYINLNSPLLSFASSSSTTSQDAAGYRNEYL